MISSFLTKVFGSKNERELKKLQPIIEQINALETDLKALSDDQLKGHTAKFKERLQKGELGLDIYGMREKLEAKGLRYVSNRQDD